MPKNSRKRIHLPQAVLRLWAAVASPTSPVPATDPQAPQPHAYSKCTFFFAASCFLLLHNYILPTTALWLCSKILLPFFLFLFSQETGHPLVQEASHRTHT